MHSLNNIQTVSTNPPTNKQVLLRVDFNVTLTPGHTIADDARITQTLPTIRLLLSHHNKIIIISHLDRPKGRDPKCSLRVVADRLQQFFPEQHVVLVDDFASEEGKALLEKQTENDIYLLENIRFYPGEQTNDQAFAQSLASLGDVFVNDAFGVCHREDTSVVALPHYLPSFAGLLLEKEMRAISSLLDNPKKPVVAIIGGAKISTKITFLSKLIEKADTILLGGGIANTFLLAKGCAVGKSLVEIDQVEQAQYLLDLANTHGTSLLLPVDAVGLQAEQEVTYSATAMPEDFTMLDIGPQTQTLYKEAIANANTIVWSGPVGYCEKAPFDAGTEALFYAIAHNDHAFSLVGGGDTLAAISKKDYVSKISHISTGGGAMLAFIENGTLPGITALEQSDK